MRDAERYPAPASYSSALGTIRPETRPPPATSTFVPISATDAWPRAWRMELAEVPVEIVTAITG